MPVCPHCTEESPRRRKSRCPVCGGRVHIVRRKKKTIWVAEKTNATELVYFLEEHIRKRDGMQHFTFGEPGTSPRFGQAGAAMTLLERCGWSQRLAIEVINAYYAGDRRLYPPKTMYGVIGKQFNVALAISKHRIEQRDKEFAAEQRRLKEAEQQMSAFDLFMPS